MKKYLIGSIIILFLLLGFTIRSNRTLRDTNRRQTSNIEAITDTLKQYQLKDGRSVSEIQSLKSTNKELEILNNGLYNDKKYLEKQLNIQAQNIQTLKLQAKINTKYDTVIINKKVIDANTTKFILSAEEIDSTIITNIQAIIDIFSDSNSVSIIHHEINSQVTVNNLKLSIITGYRRKGLFRRNETFISVVTTNDSRFTISNIDSWTDF